MQFIDFQHLFTQHSKRVLSLNNLFLLDVEKDDLWETYLESFPPEFNQIFRERREFDCSCCRGFVKNYGNLVAITDTFDVVTLWDFNTNDRVFQPVLEAMRSLLQAEVDRAFFNKSPKLGTKVNHEELENGYMTWNHLHMEVPAKYVKQNVAECQEEKRSIAQVLRRSLEEISSDSIATVLELIAEKILYRGEEWLGALTKFQQVHTAYHQLRSNKRNKFAWKVSGELGVGVAKIRNHSIGTLLTDLTQGMDVELAVRRYESIMAPTNYKRPKTIYTPRMVEQARQIVEEMGLGNSLGRRYAIIRDLTINNVLWANRNARKGNQGLDVFSQLREELPVNPNTLRNVQPIHIEDFLKASGNYQSIEVLFEQRLAGNLMSLIAPNDLSAPSLFKWSNGFSWAYNGNVADSMKQQVKEAGGDVNGVLRFSIRWNTQADNRNDYDAHARVPGGHIYYGGKKHDYGQLDVDIINPGSKVAVENITWPSADKMKKGTYTFSVNNFSHNGGTNGFDAEIEIDGEVYTFEYPHDLAHKKTVDVAEVGWDGKQFTVKQLLKGNSRTATSRELWGINTNQFQPVSTVMLSPNYWEGELGIGNCHCFFMLNGCINDGTPNGFYNEFLNEQLTPHRKVFEALGSKMKVEASEHQLSGLGFSTTRRESLIVRINNSHMAKIVF